MIKNSNLIAKLVELPEKEWVALAKKGHNLPAGRFSMRKVMKNINYSEMLKLMTEHEKQCLLIKALNANGFSALRGEDGSLNIDCIDVDKVNAFINFLHVKNPCDDSNN